MELPLGLAPMLGAVGAGADLGLGVYSLRHADNRYARYEGLAKLATGSTAITMLSGGPLLPLLGTVLALEGVRSYAGHKQKRQLPPLADALPWTNPAAKVGRWHTPGRSLR